MLLISRVKLGLIINMEWIKKYIGVISVITVLIIQIVVVTSFAKDLEGRTVENKNNIERVEKDLKEHEKNPSVHMDLEKKIETFVLRKEYEPTVHEFREDLKIIKSDIKKILQRVR